MQLACSSSPADDIFMMFRIGAIAFNVLNFRNRILAFQPLRILIAKLVIAFRKKDIFEEEKCNQREFN